VANVGAILLNQVLGQFVQAIKVVAGVGNPDRLESQPRDNLLNGIKVLSLLARRIGIVKAENASSVMEFCKAKVDGQRLAVPNVKIALDIVSFLYPELGESNALTLGSGGIRVSIRGVCSETGFSLYTSARKPDLNIKFGSWTTGGSFLVSVSFFGCLGGFFAGLAGLAGFAAFGGGFGLSGRFVVSMLILLTLSVFFSGRLVGLSY
jgi:hypothetical protein